MSNTIRIGKLNIHVVNNDVWIHKDGDVKAAAHFPVKEVEQLLTKYYDKNF